MSHDFNLVFSAFVSAASIAQIGFQAVCVILGIIAGGLIVLSNIPMPEPVLTEDDWFEAVEYVQQVDEIASPLREMDELMRQEEADAIPTVWHNYLLPSEELVVEVPKLKPIHTGIPFGGQANLWHRPQVLLV